MERSASEIADGMAAMDALEIVAGKATAAAPGALLSTFILTEGVYGIMIVFSYLYDKMKKEREEYYRHAGRSERDEELAERDETLAKRDEQVAALKARAAERDEALAKREEETAALKAQLAARQEVTALGSQIADGIARGNAERDQEIAALKAQVAELQRRVNGNSNSSGNPGDESPNP